MIILKLITIIFLTLFIWLIMQLVISGFKVFSFFKYGMRNPQQQRAPHGQTTMVKCAACHLYVLDSDAIVRNGTPYCSLEHAKQH